MVFIPMMMPSPRQEKSALKSTLLTALLDSSRKLPFLRKKTIRNLVAKRKRPQSGRRSNSGTPSKYPPQWSCPALVRRSHMQGTPQKSWKPSSALTRLPPVLCWNLPQRMTSQQRFLAARRGKKTHLSALSPV
ncbi:Hypothetical protein [Corynebacterium glutamicum ATCC 13032]|uniref:Uncharacterized protein n=1 Tax=Corynebacterium glutamicum (strain ATCC 13032 / DSM 20300 / JCM 1318 / BCRC 11384 / CCUG 27702 / LMG 3730 / NBRC 12168 / NCIMB 10025 / NRRL B-2784 / 534) TaxID=196627 RepID=Q8NSE0_CORGL|nr:Hypothetical protein [Corynebacterium glutamicum ATCC 13032]